MRQANITTIKEKIMEIRFGILKTVRASVLKAPSSLMIETIELTADGHLLCTIADPSAFNRMATESLAVTVKYVQKSEGLFIKLTGRTVISNSIILQNSLNNKSQPNYDTTSPVIKILIDDVHCFKKKCMSPYTSFLQSLSTFTGIHQIGRAV
jgi:hypothetical protein